VFNTPPRSSSNFNMLSMFVTTAEKPLIHMDALLPDEILRLSPSEKVGISGEDEFKHRALGCDFICQACVALQLPVIATITGQNILHRFFYRRSLLDFDVFTVSMGSVTVAAKAVDSQIACRDVLSTFFSIYLRRKEMENSTLSVGSEQFIKWKNELQAVEMFILKELGFCIYQTMQHPHELITSLVKTLQCEELTKQAIECVNECMRTDLPLRRSAPDIAAAAIYVAADVENYALPDDHSWYVSAGIPDHANLRKLADEILLLKSKNKEILQWIEPLKASSIVSACFSNANPANANANTVSVPVAVLPPGRDRVSRFQNLDPAYR
jgi:hypothetical protein